MSETVTQVSETEQKIVRSRTCGCRDFYIAKLTQNDATGYVAGTPVKLARAIKAKVDEKWSSEKIYSDDGTEEVINSYEGTEIELEVNALAPQDRQILFGQLYERENCLRQQRASRVHSMREVLTMHMRFLLMNQTL